VPGATQSHDALPRAVRIEYSGRPGYRVSLRAQNRVSMVDSILCIHVGAVGDVVLALPALAELGRTFSRVTIACAENRGVIARMAACADRSVSIESHDLWRLLAQPGAVTPRCMDFLAQYDAAVVWVTDPADRIRHTLAACGIENTVVAPGVPPKEWPVHASRYYLTTLEPFGVTDGWPRAAAFEPGKSAIRWADKLLAGSNEPVVAIHPGSGSRKKCWPIDRFAEVAVWVRDEVRGRPVWITGPAEDRPAIETGPAKSGLPVHSIPFPQLVALAQSCALYLGNDCGPTHLAAATGVPTIALFGPTDPAVWSPLGDRVVTLRGDDASIESIRVRDVLAAAEKVIYRTR